MSDQARGDQAEMDLGVDASGLDGPGLRAALEALLLVVDNPTPADVLAAACDAPVARVEADLRAWAAELTARGSGMDLRRVGDGWRLHTRDTFAPQVERLVTDGSRSRLTRAALETLAVVAYRQPLTRSRIAAVRGVNVDGVVRTLLARGMLAEAGTDPETHATLYSTTGLFLERLGLASLADLPPLAPLLPEVDLIDEQAPPARSTRAGTAPLTDPTDLEMTESG